MWNDFIINHNKLTGIKLMNFKLILVSLSILCFLDEAFVKLDEIQEEQGFFHNIQIKCEDGHFMCMTPRLPAAE